MYMFLRKTNKITRFARLLLGAQAAAPVPQRAAATPATPVVLIAPVAPAAVPAPATAAATPANAQPVAPVAAVAPVAPAPVAPPAAPPAAAPANSGFGVGTLLIGLLVVFLAACIIAGLVSWGKQRRTRGLQAAVCGLHDRLNSPQHSDSDEYIVA